MKDSTALLQDMLAAITSIESYAITPQEAFFEDEKTQDAIMFNLIIMGEAASKISHEFQEMHPEIPWSSVIGSSTVMIR
jgi:uncharacterized protein with HEPN domain